MEYVYLLGFLFALMFIIGTFDQVMSRYDDSVKAVVIFGIIAVWLGLGLWFGLRDAGGKYYPDDYQCSQVGQFLECD